MQESNLLRLAEQQAKREEELNGARQQVADLEAEVADLVREMELRQEQEAALKEVRLLTSTITPLPWFPRSRPGR